MKQDDKFIRTAMLITTLSMIVWLLCLSFYEYPVQWQSAAWIYQPDGSRVQFGLRADGVVVWRKLPEEKTP